MKAFFGLLLLSGVLAVQESGKPQKVPCRLLVNNLVGGPRMSSITKMNGSAYNALIRFLKKQNLDIPSVVCVTKQIVAGYSYRVQYNGFNWVQISISVSGEVQITDKGVISEPTKQPL